MSAVKAVRSEGWDNRLSAPLRGEVEAQLEMLKERLLKPMVEKVHDRALVREILWAANEAAALAWCTICPVLMLPMLLEEKVREAIAKWEKQQRVKAELFKRERKPRFGRHFISVTTSRRILPGVRTFLSAAPCEKPSLPVSCY